MYDKNYIVLQYSRVNTAQGTLYRLVVAISVHGYIVVLAFFAEPNPSET